MLNIIPRSSMNLQCIFWTILSILSLTCCAEHICDSEPSGCAIGVVDVLQTRVARDDLRSQVVSINLNKQALPNTSNRFAESIPVKLRQEARNSSEKELIISTQITRTIVPYIYNLTLTPLLSFLRNGPVFIESDELGTLPNIFVYYENPLTDMTSQLIDVSNINGRLNFAPIKLAISGPSTALSEKQGERFLLAFSHVSRERFSDTNGALMYKYTLPTIGLGATMQGTFAYSSLTGYSLAAPFYLGDKSSLTFLIAYSPNNIGNFVLLRCTDTAPRASCVSAKTGIDSSLDITAAYSYRNLSIDPRGKIVALSGRQTQLELYDANNIQNTPQVLMPGPLQALAVDYLSATLPDVIAVDNKKQLIISKASPLGIYEDFQTALDLQSMTNTMVSAIAVGDINGDQFPDLAVASGQEILIFFNRGTGTMPIFSINDPLRLRALKYQIQAMILSDLDGDGLVDIVASESDFKSTSSPSSFIEIFYTNTGKRQF